MSLKLTKIWTPWYYFRRLGISFHGGRAPSRTGRLHFRSFSNTMKHTTLTKIPLDEGSARQRDLYLAQKTPRTYRHKLPAGFEISTNDGAQTYSLRSYDQWDRHHW